MDSSSSVTSTFGRSSVTTSQSRRREQLIHTKTGGNDNAAFYVNPQDYSRLRPETSPNQSLKTSRFEIYTNLRKSPMRSEFSESAHLGPGTYEFHDYSNRPKTVSIAGSCGSRMFNSVPRDALPYEMDAIYERDRGPPPGTYNVPRIFGFEGYAGAEIGIQIRSPFTNRGQRDKELSPDGEKYTSHFEVKQRFPLGPGYYDFKDDWTPSSFLKYNKKYPKPEPKHREGRDDPALKPWRTLGPKPNKPNVMGATGASIKTTLTPTSTSGSAASISVDGSTAGTDSPPGGGGGGGAGLVGAGSSPDKTATTILRPKIANKSGRKKNTLRTPATEMSQLDKDIAIIRGLPDRL